MRITRFRKTSEIDTKLIPDVYIYILQSIKDPYRFLNCKFKVYNIAGTYQELHSREGDCLRSGMLNSYCKKWS